MHAGLRAPLLRFQSVRLELDFTSEMECRLASFIDVNVFRAAWCVKRADPAESAPAAGSRSCSGETSCAFVCRLHALHWIPVGPPAHCPQAPLFAELFCSFLF